MAGVAGCRTSRVAGPDRLHRDDRYPRSGGQYRLLRRGWVRHHRDHGRGNRHETIAAAEQHPDALFVIMQPAHEPLSAPANLVKLEFQGGTKRLSGGAAAAMMTQTRHVAAVCEAEFIDYVERYCEGFAAGANFVDPQVRTRSSTALAPMNCFSGTPNGAKPQPRKSWSDGADVVFAVGEDTARAALVEAARRGRPGNRGTDGRLCGAARDSRSAWSPARRWMCAGAAAAHQRALEWATSGWSVPGERGPGTVSRRSKTGCLPRCVSRAHEIASRIEQRCPGH